MVKESSPQSMGKPIAGTEGSPKMSPACSWRAGGSLAARHAVPSLLSLSEARPRSVLIAACKCLHGDKIPGTKGLFNLAVKGRPRTSSWKQKPRESYLEKRCVFAGGRERGLSAQGRQGLALRTGGHRPTMAVQPHNTGGETEARRGRCLKHMHVVSGGLGTYT